MRGRYVTKKMGDQGVKEPSVRERILAAAFCAFAEHGFARASTLEIATRAKVSKRELYSLFGSKQQMLVTCISERATRMRLPTDWPAPRNHGDLEAGLVEIGSVLMREISDPDVIAVYRLAVSEAERAPEVAQALDQYGREAGSAALRQYLEKAQSAGLLARGNSDRMVSRFFALLLEGLLINLALGVVKRPTPTEIRRSARDATQAFLTLYWHRGAAPADRPVADRVCKATEAK